MSTDIREQVRETYAEAARAASAFDDCGCGCGCGDGSASSAVLFGEGLYGPSERAEIPDAAARASLGCGNPVAVAELHPGETVLDLGSEAGSTSSSRLAGSARPEPCTGST